MKLIFNDASTLQIQKIDTNGDYLMIKTISAAPADLKTMFSDPDKTRILKVTDDRGAELGKYEGFTEFYSTEEYAGKIYGVTVYKPDKTPEAQAAVLESSVKVTKIQAQSLTDAEALTVQNLYPEWSDVIGQTVALGFKFNYAGTLYKTIQDSLLIQEQYIPGEGTESLYAIIDETHAGTLEDPIPYNGNMELFNGKYYSQDEVIYKCTRDSEQPLYHDLASLVGLYVEVAE